MSRSIRYELECGFVVNLVCSGLPPVHHLSLVVVSCSISSVLKYLLLANSFLNTVKNLLIHQQPYHIQDMLYRF
jgi:hypothetical protein